MVCGRKEVGRAFSLEFWCVVGDWSRCKHGKRIAQENITTIVANPMVVLCVGCLAGVLLMSSQSGSLIVCGFIPPGKPKSARKFQPRQKSALVRSSQYRPSRYAGIQSVLFACSLTRHFQPLSSYQTCVEYSKADMPSVCEQQSLSRDGDYICCSSNLIQKMDGLCCRKECARGVSPAGRYQTRKRLHQSLPIRTTQEARPKTLQVRPLLFIELLFSRQHTAVIRKFLPRIFLTSGRMDATRRMACLRWSISR